MSLALIEIGREDNDHDFELEIITINTERVKKSSSSKSRLHVESTISNPELALAAHSSFPNNYH